jgi:hypothetical protein
LLPGTYRAALGPGLSDLGGNRIVTPKRWNFFVIAGVDRDQDGLPDAVELQLGSDPSNPFSQNDGVKDGLRDFDRDNLPNSGELLFGLDPRNAHTVNPSILDGNLDSDGDVLSNAREFQTGTSPGAADTDGDGFNDEVELTAGSDPLSRLSTPVFYIVGQPAVSAGLPSLPPQLAYGIFTSAPSLSAAVPQLTPGQSLIVGLPAVSGIVPAFPPGGLQGSLFVGRPDVSVGVTGLNEGELFKAPFVALPQTTGKLLGP